MCLREFISPLHPGTNKCWRCIQNCDAVLCDDFKHPPLMRGIRSSFIDHLCCTVNQWPINNVRVTGNPANIGRAPIDIRLGLEIKDCSVSKGSLCEITACCMENSLWFSCRSRCVQDKEWVLSIKALSNMFCALAIDNFMPPNVGIAIPCCFLPGALYDKDLLNIGLTLKRFINCRLKCKCRTLSKSTICGNHKLCICILNT